MVGNIVIALHGDISARAVPFAEGIAQRWGGHLVVLHAIGRGAHTSHPAWVDLHPVVQQPRDSGIRWRGCGACGGAITGDRGRRARSRRSSTVLGQVRGAITTQFNCARPGSRMLPRRPPLALPKPRVRPQTLPGKWQRLPTNSWKNCAWHAKRRCAYTCM